MDIEQSNIWLVCDGYMNLLMALYSSRHTPDKAKWEMKRQAVFDELDARFSEDIATRARAAFQEMFNRVDNVEDTEFGSLFPEIYMLIDIIDWGDNNHEESRTDNGGLIRLQKRFDKIHETVPEGSPKDIHMTAIFMAYYSGARSWWLSPDPLPKS